MWNTTLPWSSWTDALGVEMRIKNWKKTIALALFVALLLPAAALAGKKTGTICFYVLCDTGQIEADDGTTVRLTAKKGAKELDNTFVFPKGSRASTAVDHFASAASDAGFTEGTDFVKAGNCLKFKDPDRIDGGTQNRCQYKVTYAVTEGVEVGSAPVSGGKVKVDSDAPSGGTFSLAAYGVKFTVPGDVEGELASANAFLEVVAGDTPFDMLSRFAAQLTESGWAVVHDVADGSLQVMALPDGTPVSGLSMSFLDDGQLSAGSSCSAATPLSRDVLHWQLSIGESEM